MDLQRATTLAVDCMNHHGLLQGHNPWRFQFDNAKRRLGVCKLRTRTISLSKHFVRLNTEDEVLDTILHEIAHALAPAHVHHGYEWKMIARSIGAKPERCGGDGVVQVHTGWKGFCNDCGKELRRVRRPSPVMISTGYHTKCRYKANKGKLTWKFKGSVVLAEKRTRISVLASTIDAALQSV